MKLITLNVEGPTYVDKVLPFLLAESPDVVCLQEATVEYEAFFIAQGYRVVMEPRCIREHNGVAFIDGVMLASRLPMTAEVFCYHDTGTGIEREYFDEVTGQFNSRRHIILGTITDGVREYRIGTTHFTWTKDGDIACQTQQMNMLNFMEIVGAFPAHIMCGDFNIPRGYNKLYEVLAHAYQDNIPTTCMSSLDAEHHRLKDMPEKAELLQRYMVDYIFSQAPYQVTGVRQVFGVSDHAATVALIG
jgi:endonuclease/exonuclease/phosphatase family metal-dependent hydrolase